MKVITAQQLKDFAAKLELDDTIDFSNGSLYATVSRQELFPTEEHPCTCDTGILCPRHNGNMR